jgi:hypothetical protein
MNHPAPEMPHSHAMQVESVSIRTLAGISRGPGVLIVEFEVNNRLTLGARALRVRNL